MTSFPSIKEAHEFFSLPGIPNKRYIFDKEGMVRIYSIPGYGDLIKENTILFWTKQETMGKHFGKSMKAERPVKVFRKQENKVEYLGEWNIHDIQFSYVSLKRNDPSTKH